MLTRNGKRTLDEYFNDTDSPTHSSPPPDSEQPPAKKTKKYPKFFDGKYFSIQSDINGNVEAICSECQEIKRGNFLSTGNFFSHYKLKHNSKLQELKEYTKEGKKTPTQPTLNDMVSALTPDNVCEIV